MKDEINLLVKEKRGGKTNRSVFVISGGFFVITFIISVILLVYSLSLSSKVSALKSQENNLRNQLSGFTSQKAKLLSINERLSTIKKIVAERKTISERAESMFALIGEDFLVKSFLVDNQNVKINLVSESLSKYNDLLEARVAKFAKDKPFGLSKINLDSFRETDDGYSANLTFEYISDEK